MDMDKIQEYLDNLMDNVPEDEEWKVLVKTSETFMKFVELKDKLSSGLSEKESKWKTARDRLDVMD